MDLAKYRAIFIEESTEHFAEISQALLELEKDPVRVESIDVVFRMAHSIKGMAAWVTRKTADRLVSTTESHSSSVKFFTVRSRRMAALLIRKSIRPNFAFTAVKN